MFIRIKVSNNRLISLWNSYTALYLSPTLTTPQVTTSNFINQPWASVASYARGGVVSTTINLTTNHGGRFSMYLCNSKSASGLTVDCFIRTPLINVETGTTKWWIQDAAQFGWRHTMDWKLPEGFSCPNGCVLMWEYVAMQACVEGCDCTKCGSYCNGTNPVGGYRDRCGRFEIFRNCADVIIAWSDWRHLSNTIMLAVGRPSDITNWLSATRMPYITTANTYDRRIKNQLLERPSNDVDPRHTYPVYVFRSATDSSKASPWLWVCACHG